ncbi:MAG: hypothetical protein PUA52_07030 [Lachnospiraceae bacterium]|nr:hypothetical protein [Lachnospiraceae bacterium]
MVYIILGTAAFVCYIFFDLNTVYFRTKGGRCLFWLGCLLLVPATAGIIIRQLREGAAHALSPLWCLASLIMLGLLIYTLFFALPAAEAYSGESDIRRPVCRSGMYALCRHPGVLWLGGLYAGLFLALPGWLSAAAGIVFFILDVVYVVIQDSVIFPQQFSDYGDYRKTTPFLIPTAASLRRCLSHLK